MKKIGFLSFGHWTPSRQSQARSAADVLLQSIDLAVEAEHLGMDWNGWSLLPCSSLRAATGITVSASNARTRIP